MFSDSLIKALRQGHSFLGPRLSLSELGDLVKANLQVAYPDVWVRPEVHSPDQREGDVANVSLFPNPAFDLRKAEDGAASLETEAREKAEAARREHERAEQARRQDEADRMREEREAREKQTPVRAEQDRQEQEEQQHEEQEKAKRERLKQLKQERTERERQEQEKQEQAEQERLEREKKARDRAKRARLNREKRARDRAEQERLEREKEARDRAEQERLEREKQARPENEERTRVSLGAEEEQKLQVLDETWEAEKVKRYNELSRAIIDEWPGKKKVAESPFIRQLRANLQEWLSTCPPGFEYRQIQRLEKQKAEANRALRSWLQGKRKD